MLTPNYGCVGATDKFTSSDAVSLSVLYLSCFSFMWTIVQLFYSFIYHLMIKTSDQAIIEIKSP